MKNRISTYIFTILLLTPFLFYGQLNKCINNNIITKYLQLGDYHSALILINADIDKFLYNPNSYFQRGRIYLELGSPDLARIDFQQAKKMNFNFPDKFFDYFISPENMVNEIAKTYFDSIHLTKAENYKPAITHTDSLQGGLRQERECFDVYYYDLHVNIYPKMESIDGYNTIYFLVKNKTNKIQIDLFEQYEIIEVTWKNQNLTYHRDHNAIFISFPEYLELNSSQQLMISYKGIPRVAKNPPWNGGFIWEISDSVPYIGVTCEHLGASSWWPNKDHLSDKPDSMKITIGAPNNLYVVANGNYKKTYELGSNYSAHEWFVSYPIPNYSVSFYIGDFVNYTELFKNKNSSYNIDYYVLKKNLELAKNYYSKTSGILEVFENIFGEYPFKNDGVGLVEAPYKGMEHQSAIAIGDDYTEPKYRGYDDYGYNFLLIHELSHEWWGNAVAIEDMADAWINEGFATYAEALFVEKKFDYNEYLKVIQVNSRKINNLIPIVGEKNVNDNTFFTGDIYSKGATLLHNLRCVINNDSLFFSAIKEFYQGHIYKTCNTTDFIDLMQSKTNLNLTPFFNKFFYDNRLPVLEYHYNHIDTGIKVLYKWTEVENGFTMPISIKPNNGEYIKLTGTTNYQEIVLKKANFFVINNITNYTGYPQKNSITYFWTNLLAPKQLFE